MTRELFRRIGTHDGSFHSDDVLAISILTTIFPNHAVVRTRDQDVLDFLDIVVDVGGVYNHRTCRYDHHMANPPTDRRGNLLSSAGLIWEHFWAEYLNSIGMPKMIEVSGNPIDLHVAVRQFILHNWIQPIDKSDNGVINTGTPIGDLVKAMRPTDPEKSAERYNAQFIETVSMVSHIFKRTCFHGADRIISRIVCANQDPEMALDGKVAIVGQNTDDFHRFLNMGAHFLIYPTGSHGGDDAKFVVRPLFDDRERPPRTPFPRELFGQRETYFEKTTDQRDVIFVHHTGFLAFCKTQEAAIGLCQHSLNYHTKGDGILPS